MTEKEEAMAIMSAHVAAGKPVVIATTRPFKIGEVHMYEYYGVDIQNMRIVRKATRAEYLAMPFRPDDEDRQLPPGWLYFYALEGD